MSGPALLPLPQVTVSRPRPSEFLAAWFAGCPLDHFMEYRALPLDDGRPRQAFFPIGAVGSFLSAAFPLVEDHNVYFGAAPRTHKNGSKAAVRLAPGLWADVDSKTFAEGEAEVWATVQAFRPAPTWIVRTGGGWHCYWKLRAPVLADDRFEAHLKRLAAVLRADPAAAEKARILRLPATFNHKYSNCQVELVSWPR